MLNQKRTAQHEANNAYSAALILRNRASQPLCLIRWAEACQQRQRAERVRDGQPGHLVPTAAAPERPRAAKAASSAAVTQLPLLLEGVNRGAA